MMHPERCGNMSFRVFFVIREILSHFPYNKKSNAQRAERK